MTNAERPGIGVGILIEKEGKILLGKRTAGHGAGTWSLPGGHLEFGETVKECAARELLEETGLQMLSCTLGPWIETVNTQDHHHSISFFVIVDQCEGVPHNLEPHKCEGWHWFAWDQLPSPLFTPLQTFLKQHLNT